MNIFRAGFFSFASTAKWLHERGTASPPLLVALGLTLPDSRILSGVASIGLTLANIAAILPHLRQPILNSMYCFEKALRSTEEEITLCLDGSSTTQSGDLPVESPVLASGSPHNREDSDTTQPLDQPVESPESPVLTLRLPRESERQGQPLACSATTEVICPAEKEAPGCLNVESEVAPRTAPPPSVGKTGDNEALSQILSSLDADSSRARISASHLFAQEGWGLPLLVPDAEIVFFETDDVSYEGAPGEESTIAAREEDAVPEEHSAIKNHGLTTGEDGQLLVVHLPGAQSRVELDIDMATPVADGNAWSPPRNDRARGHQNNLVGTSTLPNDIFISEPALQNVQLDKRRPECLEFIPQSVIRQNPSAPMGSVGRFGHRTFNPGHDHQFPSAPPVALVSIHNPEMSLQETKPPANYTTLKGHWGVSFPTPTRWFVEGNTLSAGNVPAHQSVNRRPISLPEPPTIHEPTRLQTRPTHSRRLGVLARAALRDRRAAARKRIDDENDDSSASDSNPDSDSHSQYSSGSSTYGGMLPHMLGTDLIAAIDADDESEPNLCGPKKTRNSPLNLYEDFLNSEDSTANVSVIMQVSSNGDDSDSEIGVPATSRRLTYEDIQQWATGVVQKCVRQVCRNHVAAEPSSPSQASEVCAERPSGSGASQCPLSGLHCKLGAAASTDEVPAPGTEQVPVPLPPTSTQPSRKPLQLRNLRDIPEFVPRQRLISARAGNPRRTTRSGINATHEAATQVIARMENRAGSNARRWLTGGKRMVNTAGDGQGVLRCV